MTWFGQRTRTAPASEPSSEPPEDPGQEGAAPGLAALFDGIEAGGALTLLDLGPSTAASFALYRPYARRVRYLDLLEEGFPHAPGDPGVLAEPVRREPEAVQTDVFGEPLEGSAPARPAEPGADLILAWDTLDWTPPADRRGLVESLARRAAPGARLHLVTRALVDAPRERLVFTPLGEGRIRIERAGGRLLEHPFLQPAEVTRLLEPFVVRRGFVLKSGLREYLAAMPTAP